MIKTMAYTATPTKFISVAQVRTSMYQEYLKDSNSFSDYIIGLCAGRGASQRIQRAKTMKYLQSLRDEETSASTSAQPTFHLLVKDHPITSQSLFGDETLNTNATATSLPSTKYLYCNASINTNDSLSSGAYNTTFGPPFIPPSLLSASVSEKSHITYLEELKSLRLAKNEKLAKEKEQKKEKDEGAKQESRAGSLGPKVAPMMKQEAKRCGPKGKSVKLREILRR